MFKNDWSVGTTTDERIGTKIPPVNIQESEDRFLGFNIELNNLSNNFFRRKEGKQS